MGFRHLKAGDRVNRMIGPRDKPQKWMEMEVLKVDENIIECGAINSSGEILKLGWTFHRDDGCEEDSDLRWGKEYGQTGSFLEEIKKE